MTKKKLSSPKDEDKESSVILEKNDFKFIKFSHNQLALFKTIKENFVTVCTGPAGTAKTFVSCYTALDMLKDGLVKKIILVRPAVESGENLGFLPGTLEEKLAPYMEGYLSNMEKILHSNEKLKYLLTNKLIDVQPLAFMRSKTFDDAIIILDEAQNADLRQIMLVVTRLGKNSKIVICGDITQWDIAARQQDLLVFADNIVNDVNKCVSFNFEREDIVRHPLLIAITDNYEKYKESKKLK